MAQKMALRNVASLSPPCLKVETAAQEAVPAGSLARRLTSGVKIIVTFLPWSANTKVRETGNLN